MSSASDSPLQLGYPIWRPWVDHRFWSGSRRVLRTKYLSAATSPISSGLATSCYLPADPHTNDQTSPPKPLTSRTHLYVDRRRRMLPIHPKPYKLKTGRIPCLGPQTALRNSQMKWFSSRLLGPGRHLKSEISPSDTALTLNTSSPRADV